MSKYVLVDFENVQPSSLNGLSEDYSVYMFMGRNQYISGSLEKSLKRFQDVSKIYLEIQGKNALDFYLSYYLGRILKEDKCAEVIIVSGDKGYDPLIQHTRKHCKSIKRIGKEDVYQVLASQETIDYLSHVLGEDFGFSREGLLDFLHHPIRRFSLIQNLIQPTLMENPRQQFIDNKRNIERFLQRDYHTLDQISIENLVHELTYTLGISKYDVIDWINDSLARHRIEIINDKVVYCFLANKPQPTQQKVQNPPVQIEEQINLSFSKINDLIYRKLANNAPNTICSLESTISNILKIDNYIIQEWIQENITQKNIQLDGDKIIYLNLPQNNKETPLDLADKFKQIDHFLLTHFTHNQPSTVITLVNILVKELSVTQDEVHQWLAISQAQKKISINKRKITYYFVDYNNTKIQSISVNKPKLDLIKKVESTKKDQVAKHDPNSLVGILERIDNFLFKERDNLPKTIDKLADILVTKLSIDSQMIIIWLNTHLVNQRISLDGQVITYHFILDNNNQPPGQISTQSPENSIEKPIGNNLSLEENFKRIDNFLAVKIKYNRPIYLSKLANTLEKQLHLSQDTVESWLQDSLEQRKISLNGEKVYYDFLVEKQPVRQINPTAWFSSVPSADNFLRTRFVTNRPRTVEALVNSLEKVAKISRSDAIRWVKESQSQRKISIQSKKIIYHF